MMRKMVRDFAKTEIEPFIERMEQGEFPREILKKMGELGLMGITVPEKYGGAGMDFISYIIAIHELSKVSARCRCYFICSYISWYKSNYVFRKRRAKKTICSETWQVENIRCILFNRTTCRFRCRLT